MNCPFCNQTIPDGSGFCGFCGKKIETAQPLFPEFNESEAVEDVTEALDAAEAVEPAGDSVGAEAEYAAETAASTASSLLGASETAIPAPEASSTANQQGFGASPVNLGKSQPDAGAQSAVNPANDVVDHIKDGIQDAAQAVQVDAQAAAAAVKSGRFKDLLKNKTFLICCAALIVVILLIVIIICFVSGGSKIKVKGAYYSVNDSGDAIYFYNGTEMKGVDLSSYSSIVATSLDGTVALVNDGEELYIFDSGKAKLITDELDTRNASISANGKTVAYACDDAVYVYTGSKSKKIADLEDDSSCFPVISPDGKVVAFSDYDDDDVKTYAWKGSKVIDLDADIVPYSVSNGGKMIFGLSFNYDNYSYDLYYLENLKKGSEQKIESSLSVVGISFDHTKILYHSDGSTYCFDASIDDDDVRITRGEVDPVSDFSYQGAIPYIENFKKFYGTKNGDLYKYSRKGKEYEDEKILSDAFYLTLSEDHKKFAYIDDGDLMQGTISNAKNEKKVGKDVLSFDANKTLSSVFYLDDEYNLRYAGKDGKIASEVRGYIVTDGGVCVFYDEDGDLYYSAKGGEKEKTSLDEIGWLAIRNNVVYAVSDGQLYVSTNGKSFKKTGVDVEY